jgi:hypothetical protein
MKAAQRDAKRFRDATARYDAVWCVCDCDDHPRLKEAVIQARDNGIRLVLSNPCFELWVLLHFDNQTAHIHRSKALEALRRFIPSYSKRIRWSQLRELYDVAVKRSIGLRKSAKELGEDLRNPSTDVDLLTEALLMHVAPSGIIAGLRNREGEGDRKGPSG